MKTPFHQNRIGDYKSVGKKGSKKLVVILLVVLFFIGVVSPLRGLFAGLLNYVSVPIWYIRERVAIKMPETSSYFALKKNLYLENEKLKETIRNLESLKIENKSLLDENSELKDVLDLRETSHKRFVAPILARPNQSSFDTLIISVGRKSGISVGNLVYERGKFALGKVIEIYQDSAKVQLFSYGDSKIKVLLGKERFLLDAVGEGGQNFSVEFPADVSIKVGDIAILEDSLGSIVAIVERIISTPGGLVSQAILASPVNVNELRFVEIDVDTKILINEVKE